DRGAELPFLKGARRDRRRPGGNAAPARAGVPDPPAQRVRDPEVVGRGSRRGERRRGGAPPERRRGAADRRGLSPRAVAGPGHVVKPVTLSKDLSRAIRGGHPWVFREAVEGAPRLPSGTPVELCDRDGRPLAVGFWDARSAIAVRILEAGPLADLDAEVDRRLKAALELRLGRLDRRRTNAFRWIHGEADRLPGIHVDLYDQAAVVRYDGEGAPAFYHDLGARL